MKTHRFSVVLAFLIVAAVLPDASQAQSTLIATGSVWRFLDTGTDLSAQPWQMLSFNDSAWRSGPAELGYGDTAEGRPEATMLSFGPDANNKFITYYIRKTFVIPDASIYGPLSLRVLRDDGVVVYLNGAEIWRDNMPAGPVTGATVAPVAIGGTDEATFFPGPEISPSMLVSGTNILAVELHQSGPTSSDISFDLELRGTNAFPTVALTNPPPGSTFYAPAVITLGAIASDLDGIASVEFFQNGVSVGAVATPPYRVTLSNVFEGSYVFTASAADPLGATTVSDPVSVTVIDTNPVMLASANAGSNNVTVAFTKSVVAPGALDPANYHVNNGVSVLAAAYGATSNRVILTTTPLVSGTSYTLSASNVMDTAGLTLPGGSQVAFTYVTQTAADIGNPVTAGSSVSVPGGYNLSGAGNDIGGTADQFHFNYQPREGDFDLKVRVAGLTPTDAWAKAGLMARETLAANSRYAASFATPTVSGCFFQSRSATNLAGVNAGSFPISYPYTWLRLQRVGGTLTGLASFDGENWAPLGSQVFAGLPASLYVGMAVTSRNASQLATAGFRDLADATGQALGLVRYPTEPLGPTSRKTPFAISELNYNPPLRPDGRDLEFIEVYNSNPFSEDIGGYRISGEVDYSFPTNTVIPGGGFLVLAHNKADVESVYSLSGVLEYGRTTITYATNVDMGVTNITATTNGNRLGRSGTLRLRGAGDAIELEIPYSNDNPWPVGADGTGHSLVLARPSYGEAYPQAWGLSDQLGGSPGRTEPIAGSPLQSVLINEILAHTSTASELVDFVELYNHSSRTQDLSGCFLTDDPVTNKFMIPGGTTIPPGGFLAFDEAQLGFAMAADGETIYFKSPDGRVMDAVQYEAQADSVSTGRQPDGGREWYPLTARTPGQSNAPALIDNIVINELMYDPISGDSDHEYVELYNRGGQTVNLGGWKFTAGVNFTFKTNTLLASNAYLVVAADIVKLLARYPQLNSNNTVGNFSGSLANKGERVALARPAPYVTTNGMGQFITNTLYVVADEVTYVNGGRWGNWSAGGGSSMELINPNSNHRLAYNWADSDETAKASWTQISATGTADNGAGTANFLEFSALGEGEWLMDDVYVGITSNGTNGPNLLSALNAGFEPSLGTWGLRGNHIRTSLESDGGFSGANAMHIRTTARGDSGANRCIVSLTTAVVPGQVCTIRAQFRWLRGWPEVLLRLHGNYHEAIGRLVLPTNLGTPGQRNSRAVTNPPPALAEVRHDPVVPAASQAVVVTARIHDLNGIGSFNLNFRPDPGNVFASVAMNDRGTNGDVLAGDGIWSATIPGRPAGNAAAFYLSATDTLGAASAFPSDGVAREIPVRWGDPAPATSFGVYRLWLTQSNVNTWANRPALSNERVDGTFIYGNFRAVYNVGTKFSGSPYHQGFGNPTNNSCHYSPDLPLDDLLLGTENFNKIHSPGNGPWDDTTLQREQTCYYMVRQLGLPWNYRRFVNLFINGNRRQPAGLMEDTQTPGGDIVQSDFPDDPDGQLFKLQPWFEVDDGTAASLGFQNNSWCTLLKWTTAGGAQKTSRYRWNYLVRAADGTANDYTNVFDLVAAANATNNPLFYVTNLESVIDVDQWLRTFAIEHAVGNWDSVGAQNAQNMYGYKPRNGRWKLLIWDYNIVLGNSGSWGPGAELFHTVDGPPNGGDPAVVAIYSNPTFRRAYWSNLKDVINGPMAANSPVKGIMDAKYAAFLANGLSTGASSPQPVKDWIDQARTSISNQLMAVDSGQWRVFTPTNFTTNANFVVLSGAAPVDVRRLYANINGTVIPVSFNFPAISNWLVRVVLHSGSNSISLQGYDRYGNVLSNTAVAFSVNYTGPDVSPEGAIVFNEIMYNHPNSNANYLEIINRSATSSFDMSEWRLDGLGYKFPFGTVITPGATFLLVKNRPAFNTTFPTNASLVFDEFPGNFDPAGETIALVRPGATAVEDTYIDRVHYEPRLPWALSANGQGGALQLIDPGVDNARSSAWSDGAGWRYLELRGTAQTNGTNFLIWLQQAGDVYVDDVQLVVGTNVADGPNLLQNADFEQPLEGFWTLGSSFTNSHRSTDVAHSGGASLHVVGSGAGNQNNAVRQLIAGAVPPATNYVLAYWYRTSLAGTNLTVRLFPGSGLNSLANIRPQATSPGQTNPTAGTLPAFPLVWLNEVQPQNISGPTNRFGGRSPWLELYNSDTNVLGLEDYYLTSSYGDLQQWQFPSGVMIAPGQHLVVWADGQPGQSDATEWHTSFTLPPTNGSVALVRRVGVTPQVMDYLNYFNVGPNQSYGDNPDGQPFERVVFNTASPSAANYAPPVVLFINEWVAANQSGAGGYADPADGDYEDWVELYNPNAVSVNLSGFYMTDTLNNKTQWRIPEGASIAAGGYKIVWADGETGQNGTGTNGDLHASFNLNRGGEVIGLYAVSGTNVVPIDVVTFGNQLQNVSQGRYPDGAGLMPYMSPPTPRAPNQPGNQPPDLDFIANVTTTAGSPVAFDATATDPDMPSQTLTFSLAPGAPVGASITAVGHFTWTPGVGAGGTTNRVTVQVTDNGTPNLTTARQFTIFVLSGPHVTLSPPVDGLVTLGFGTIPGKHYRVEYKNELSDAMWEVFQDNVLAAGNMLAITDDITGHPQRFYQVVQLD